MAISSPRSECVDNLRIFVGAGISFPPPAALPLFGQLREALRLELGLHDGPVSNQLKNIAPETFFEHLAVADVPIDLILKNLFGSAPPNAVHFALAKAVSLGAEVWTSNADELIELAATKCGRTRILPMVGKDAENIPADTRLFKLHGTVSNRDTLAFRSQDVMGPISKSLRDRLISSFIGKNVLICGYLGVDPDIKPALTEALKKANTAKWFQRPVEVDFVEAQYASLRSNLSVIGTENPSADFLKELENYHLGMPLSDPLAMEAMNFDPSTHIENVNNRTREAIRPFSLGKCHLAAGSIYRHAMQSKYAIRRFWQGLFTGSICQRGKCFRGLMAAGMDENRPFAKPARWLVSLMAWLCPSRSTLAREASHLEREGKHRRALIVAERSLSLGPASPELMLHVCAPARKSGELQRAVDLSLKARTILSGPEGFQEGGLYGRALYEAAYALRLCGTWREAHDLISKYNNQGLGIYGGPRWMAWGLCLEGCVAVQSSDLTVQYNADEAICLLKKAKKILEDLDDPHRLRVVLSNMSSAYRSSRDFISAKKCFRSSKKAARRAEQRRGSILEDEVLEFEWAEIKRAEGGHDSACRRYQNLLRSTFPIHRVLGHLGLSTVDRKNPTSIAHAKEALKVSELLGFRFGIAHALVSLAMSGECPWADVKEKVAWLQVFDYQISKGAFKWNDGCDQMICFPD